MRQILTALFVATLGLTGCGSSETAADADRSETPVKTAKVGEPITVTGRKYALKLRVTARRVKPAVPTDPFAVVDRGKKLVAVKFRLVNTGRASYVEAPGNDARVVDEDGRHYRADLFFDRISVGEMLPSVVKLQPRKRTSGYITFQVPVHATITRIRFALEDSIHGAAQWNVR